MGLGVGGFRWAYCDIVTMSGVAHMVSSSSAQYLVCQTGDFAYMFDELGPAASCGGYYT